MSEFKHTIDDNGYWLSISTSGTIKLNDKWNLKSMPTVYHKWNGKDFILDNNLRIKEENIKQIEKIQILLEKNKQKLIDNKVIYTENNPKFLEYEEKYRQERSHLLAELELIKK